MPESHCAECGVSLGFRADYCNKCLPAELRDLTPELLAACKAIDARINGEFDHPALVAFGPLSTSTVADVHAIVRAAIAKAEGKS